jgi:hypothetical protein
MNQPAAAAVTAKSVTKAARVPSARGNGRPFPRGQSGNPSGQSSLFKVYAAEFGAMSPVEQVEPRRAVNLLRRAERGASDNDAVRMTREAREWLDGIRARRAHQRERSPVTAFDEYHLQQQATGK